MLLFTTKTNWLRTNEKWVVVFIKTIIVNRMFQDYIVLISTILVSIKILLKLNLGSESDQ